MKTIYEAYLENSEKIYELEPGHAAEFDVNKGELRIWRWYDFVEQRVEEKIDYLRDFANKIYVLESGRIALNGKTNEILNSKEALLSAYVG